MDHAAPADDRISDVTTLEAVVGTPPLPAMMKSIGALDDHCAAILSHAVAGVATHPDGQGGMRAVVLGGRAGFARPDGPSTLAVELPATLGPGTPVGLLAMVPGWRESLRINGRVGGGGGSGGVGGIVVEEAFVHCGKAMIRSRLWEPAPAIDARPGGAGPLPRMEGELAAFLAAAPFAVIGSCDAAGGVDASPKGDPIGVLHVLDPVTVALGERPGNRRTDTFHNLMDRPEVVALALRPGDPRTAEVLGTASLSVAPDVLDRLAVNGSRPQVALVVEVAACQLRTSDAVGALWDPASHIGPGDLPRAARIWTDHVAQDRTPGAEASAVRDGVDEDVLDAGLAVDYRTNLW